MWSRPPTCDFLVSSPSPRPLDLNDLVLALVIQVMLVELSEELFFREGGGGFLDRPTTRAGPSDHSLKFFVSRHI